ncbi:MAG: hypothetical protein ACPIOQ_78815 [Promethearchaeia archaeon]
MVSASTMPMTPSPLQIGRWLKGNEMYGDDEHDRTTFQSVIDADDYLDQPEHLKP